MGLDQYLSRRIYVGAEYEHRKVTGVIDIKVDGKPLDVDFKSVSYIEEKAGYWRKANQIHNWFVDHVQGGVDECQRSYVSRENLQELLDTVNTVLDSIKLVDGKVNAGYSFVNGEKVNHVEDGKLIEDPSIAEELLPTGAGFFFGSTEYGEWYYQDLLDTKKILEENLDEKYADVEFEYRASW